MSAATKHRAILFALPCPSKARTALGNPDPKSAIELYVLPELQKRWRNPRSEPGTEPIYGGRKAPPLRTARGLE